MDTIIDTKNWKHVPIVKDYLLFLALANEVPDRFKSYPDLEYIKHEGIRWETTDGHRLHIIEDEKFIVCEDGYYKFVLKRKTQVIIQKIKELEDGKWPDTSPIENTKYQEDPISMYNKNTGFSKSYTKIVRAWPTKKETINIQYFLDAIKHMEEGYAYIPKESSTPLLLSNYDHAKKAYIMPMRSEKAQ